MKHFIFILTLSLFIGPGRYAVAEKKPLKVFILAGQSNMQGHAKVTTFDRMEGDAPYAELLRDMRSADGTPRVCDRVWVASIGSSAEEKTGRLTAGFGAERGGPKIGPEFTFGIYMEKQLNEPILLIKTAWGGKSLHTDFRPPGAGPYQFNEGQLEHLRKQGRDLDQAAAERAEASGQYYRRMIDYVKQVLGDIRRVCPDYDAEAGHELAGFVWFQGWNDMVDRGVYPNRDQPGGYDLYTHLLTLFIHDVRRDLAEPRLPFVIGVMGVNGPFDRYPANENRYKGIHGNFRKAMAAPALLPEFEGTVAAVETADYWDTELTALRDREAGLKKKVETLSGKEQQAALEQLRAEAFTPRERLILEKGASNGGYHYLGSGLTMAGIGKGFAEAMTAMLQASN